MSRRAALLIGVLWSVLLTSIVPARSVAQPPALCLAAGDSLAAGVGSTLPRERSAAALLCRWSEAFFGTRAQLVSLARPGERASTYRASGQIDALKEEVERAARSGQPVRFVLLSLGGNDLLALQDVDDAERDRRLTAFAVDVRAAFRATREAIGPEVPLLVLTVYDPTEGDPAVERSDSWWIARFNEEITRAAEEVGGSVVDLAPVFRGHTRDWTWWPVDIHPTNAGYEAIARAAWRVLGWDRDAPQVAIERPRDGSRVARRYQTVRAVVVDPGGVEEVTLWVDGRQIGTLDPLPDGERWITLWETPWPSAGPPVTLEVRARDRAGNEGVATVRLLRTE